MQTILLLAIGALCVSNAWEDTTVRFDTADAGNSQEMYEDSAPIPATADAESQDSMIADSTAVIDDPLPAATAPPPVNADLSSPLPSRPGRIVDTLGGNLPKTIELRNGHYLVVADIYVPAGKTVTIKPGVALLFKNFTELHVEGQLIAEGTAERPIIFTSELDQDWNTASTLVANPYDWNGIFIHESGIGSRLAYCRVMHTVYGINALTRYIRIDSVIFRNNGRADLTIDGQKQQVSEKPYFYALSIADAKKDGVPVAILMDPQAKKRGLFRYGGIGIGAGGLALCAWSIALLSNDQKKLDLLSDNSVVDQTSPIVSSSREEWEQTRKYRDRDRWFVATSFILAVCGGATFGWSFTF